ncbi:AraC family transcriptional regulator [Bradyrhizobium sp.]|uniref:helix-turn-helix domain-containing protein n=1 Tax=Bradyrhizobium sp. TaxID=376 RepID=UPI0023A4E977|nr:AraC family transcriptional regulator [Bradyrhizobium sp.]MDE2378801.1 helix-turn-helix transcriptional regulator [Bradyrhizobium sp.]
MDDLGRESDHLMLITPERVFYAGFLGRPRQRTSGSCHVYVAVKGSLHLTDDDGQISDELIVTLPNQRHTIVSDYRTVISVTLEPESMPDGVLEALKERLTGPDKAAHARKILAAYALLRQRRYGDITSAEFDEMCFGEALPHRVLDPRVTRAVARIERFSGEPVTADSCAAEAGLSASRFLHLFKEETGISFRSFRAWKRARHLLHFANQDLNLAHLAQDIGYPDSTHFSHSIRRFYGLKPRAIFVGSRDLAIYRSSQTVREFAEAS